MQVKVLFFGVLAEVTGTNLKHYNDVGSVTDVKSRIVDDYPEIAHYSYRTAINNILIDVADLCDNDEIALMPPFAGG